MDIARSESSPTPLYFILNDDPDLLPKIAAYLARTYPATTVAQSTGFDHEEVRVHRGTETIVVVSDPGLGYYITSLDPASESLLNEVVASLLKVAAL